MKRRIVLMGLVGLMGLMGLMGCKEASREDKAKEAAQEYYQALLNGDYQAFLDGRAHMDSIPDSFREQLLTAFKQFMHQQQEAHQGVVSFVPTRVEDDSLLQVMQVFMMVNYADSTREEIVVPMVEHQGKWMMK
jgi:hypothetical protein